MEILFSLRLCCHRWLSWEVSRVQTSFQIYHPLVAKWCDVRYWGRHRFSHTFQSDNKPLQLKPLLCKDRCVLNTRLLLQHHIDFNTNKHIFVFLRYAEAGHGWQLSGCMNDGIVSWGTNTHTFFLAHCFVRLLSTSDLTPKHLISLTFSVFLAWCLYYQSRVAHWPTLVRDSDLWPLEVLERCSQCLWLSMNGKGSGLKGTQWMST